MCSGDVGRILMMISRWRRYLPPAHTSFDRFEVAHFQIFFLVCGGNFRFYFKSMALIVTELQSRDVMRFRVVARRG